MTNLDNSIRTMINLNSNNEITEWEKLVGDRKAVCYIKPTRLKHESGYRLFEVGYCEYGTGERIGKKKVLSHSDHIHTDFMGLLSFDRTVNINMDLTVDGYIRIWGSENKVVVWDRYPMSSAELKTIERK